MKSICVNGDGTLFGIVSDKFYYLMESEKARMMAWLADFNINSPIEKTDVFEEDGTLIKQNLRLSCQMKFWNIVMQMKKR